MKPLVETLQSWDISVTESMLLKMASEQERRKDEILKKKEAETNK